MLIEQSLVESGAVGRALRDTGPSPSAWPLPFGDHAPAQAQPWAELAALKRAQKAQAESMLMLVHELRSPVATSKSMLATLRYLDLQDEQLDSFLTRIEDRMDQLLELVSDILDLSQATSGQTLGQATVLDLVTNTRAICEPYREDAELKGLAMSADLPESPLRVRIAEQDYHLILSNLISNAVKYTFVGSIAVTLRQEGAWAVLEVQDTGIGIPQEEIPHLCTQFFRASNARQSPVPGTGLGLAGVKALVERAGGELEVASEQEVGSRFTVRLPLCK
jgi:signal transduction histidine kinase